MRMCSWAHTHPLTPFSTVFFAFPTLEHDLCSPWVILLFLVLLDIFWASRVCGCCSLPIISEDFPATMSRFHTYTFCDWSWFLMINFAFHSLMLLPHWVSSDDQPVKWLWDLFRDGEVISGVIESRKATLPLISNPSCMQGIFYIY